MDTRFKKLGKYRIICILILMNKIMRIFEHDSYTLLCTIKLRNSIENTFKIKSYFYQSIPSFLINPHSRYIIQPATKYHIKKFYFYFYFYFSISSHSETQDHQNHLELSENRAKIVEQRGVSLASGRNKRFRSSGSLKNFQVGIRWQTRNGVR